jgi:hypothetical protein
MSGRKARNAILLAIAAGIGYWIYKDRPTFSGIVDSITRPLFGSRVAVDSSERNRVGDEAGAVVADQSDASKVVALKVGMTMSDIRDLLGRPDSIDKVQKDGVEQIRWTYREARRVLVFQNNRVASIVVLQAAAAAP